MIFAVAPALNDLGAEFKINSDATNDYNTSVIRLTNGNVVSIWNVNGGSAIQGQILSPGGALLGSELTLSQNSAGLYSSAAATSDGGFVLVSAATQYNSNNQPAGAKLMFQRFDAAGAPVGSQTFFPQSGDFPGNPFDVVSTADGGFVAAYQDNIYQTYSNGGVQYIGSHIHIVKMDANNSVTQERFVGGTDSYYPQLASLADGGYAVSWSQTGPYDAQTQTHSYSIDTQTFDSNGAAGSATSVATVASGSGLENGFTHNMAALTGGGFVVVYNDGSGWGQVMAQIHNADGSAVGDPIVIGAGGESTHTAAYNGAVTSLANDGFLVTWERSGSGADSYDIFARAFDGSGNPLTDETLINTTATDRTQFIPEVTTLSNGKVIITWNDTSNHFSGAQNIVGQVVEVTCFMAGTAIQTPGGSVAVETLAPGDLVVTADGRHVPVRWLGRQTVSTVFADKIRVLPIRIRARALEENIPERDLLVSPDHAILVEDVLIYAGALVNGTSIIRETRVPPTFTYFHIEVDDHALILAEGVAAETFVDNVDRLGFDNWAEHVALYPEGKPISELPYPRAKAHRQVPAAIRAKLNVRAEAIGATVSAAVA